MASKKPSNPFEWSRIPHPLAFILGMTFISGVVDLVAHADYNSTSLKEGVMEPQHSEKNNLAHPGEVLLKEFLEPLGISQYRLSKAIDVGQMRISEIVRGKRAISIDTGLRLAKFFNTDEIFWNDLQRDHDIRLAKTKHMYAYYKIERYDGIS